MPRKKSFHVAIIPDGNRRWARTKNLPPWKGHEAGYETLKKTLEKIWDFDVTHFTFWALSTDNLKKREKMELGFLVSLLKTGIQELKESPGFKKENFRFRALGRWKDFIPELARDLEELENYGCAKADRVFVLALAYDGTEENKEMIDAIRRDAFLAAKNDFELTPLTQENIDSNLWSGFMPDVDLCIRTAGEPHLSSGFLMHKMANACLAFPEEYFPDFTVDCLKKEIDKFLSRNRRFGA